MKRDRVVSVLLVTPFLMVTALVLIAIVNILVQSLGYMPVFDLYDVTLKYYIESFKRPEVLQSLGVSLRISVFSSVIAAAIGTLICAALVKTGNTRGGMLYTVRLPILVPHTVVALFTVALLSETGMFARLAYAFGRIGDYTEFPDILYGTGYWGVILAYIWKEAPFIAYFSLALMSSVSSTLGEAVALYEAPGGAELIRGEYVLVIEGRDPEENRREEAARWESMSVAEHVAMYEKQGMDRKEAMRTAAKDRGVSRRDIYQALL